MMMNSRHSFLTLLMLTCLSVLMACSEKASEKPLSGPDLFIQTCATPGHPNADCQSRDAIEKAFGFKLMDEIDARYQKMKKTAGEIAAGKLTDEDYKVCLANGNCAEVPMLDDKLGDKTPRAKEISHAFWELAEGNYLSLAICKQMPLCSIALENGVLVAKKNKVVAAKEKQP